MCIIEDSIQHGASSKYGIVQGHDGANLVVKRYQWKKRGEEDTSVDFNGLEHNLIVLNHWNNLKSIDLMMLYR
ncbi:hypothetical protein AKJ16_DCAP26518 [Drosera capensis]